ncbi:hypothetical protein LXL04_028842 [Taraxacum kok-saghyz]
MRETLTTNSCRILATTSHRMVVVGGGYVWSRARGTSGVVYRYSTSNLNHMIARMKMNNGNKTANKKHIPDPVKWWIKEFLEISQDLQTTFLMSKRCAAANQKLIDSLLSRSQALDPPLPPLDNLSDEEDFTREPEIPIVYTRRAPNTDRANHDIFKGNNPSVLDLDHNRWFMFGWREWNGKSQRFVTTIEEEGMKANVMRSAKMKIGSSNSISNDAVKHSINNHH